MARLLLFVVAIVAFAGVFVIGVGWWDDQIPHVWAFAAVGWGCMAAALLPWPPPPR